MAVTDVSGAQTRTSGGDRAVRSAALSELAQHMLSKTSKKSSVPGILMLADGTVFYGRACGAQGTATGEVCFNTSLEGSFELNVPADAFNDALSIMSDQPQIQVGATDTQVVFEAGNTCYVSRRIEGVYPNYKQLIPDSCVTSVKIDVDAFSAALKRVAVIATSNPAVKFEIDAQAGTLSLSSISNDQDLAQETIDVEVEGESGVIAFNYHYIFGCLNVLGREKEITLELKSYAAAGVFKAYDKINYLYLVMPVRI